VVAVVTLKAVTATVAMAEEVRSVMAGMVDMGRETVTVEMVVTDLTLVALEVTQICLAMEMADVVVIANFKEVRADHLETMGA
jgi:hypothetical protein